MYRSLQYGDVGWFCMSSAKDKTNSPVDVETV